MKRLPPIYMPSKDVYWNFLIKKVPAAARRHAGQAAQAKAALRKIEEAIRERKKKG